MATKGVRKEMDMAKLSNAVEGKPMHYPSILHLDEGDLPAVKDWKVGKTYKVTLTVKQVKSSMTDMPYNDSDKGDVHCEFEVLKAESEDDGDEKGESYKEE